MFDLCNYLTEKYVIEQTVAKNICTHVLLYSLLQVEGIGRSSKKNGMRPKQLTRRD